MIEISVQRYHFGSISFKFGKFDQQLNLFAKSRNIEYISIALYDSQLLSSFNDVIGINDINNIKAINLDYHSLSFINFEEIFYIANQLELLWIISRNKDETELTHVQNLKFLSKLKSLKGLYLYNNNLNIHLILMH